MATHQEIAQVSDAELVERMTSTHADRFDDQFWEYFAELVSPVIPDNGTVLDIGCGPGLLLRDFQDRLPGAKFIGTDVTSAMIDYANNQVDYSGDKPDYKIHDVTEERLPFGDGQVDLVSMVAVLHVLNDPFAVINEIKRVLKPGGIFLLQDWVRAPLPTYFERMAPETDPAKLSVVRGRLMPLFTVHNKYTLEDWLWLLAEAGLVVKHHRQLRSPHFCTFVCTSD